MNIIMPVKFKIGDQFTLRNQSNLFTVKKIYTSSILGSGVTTEENLSVSQETILNNLENYYSRPGKEEGSES